MSSPWGMRQVQLCIIKLSSTIGHNWNHNIGKLNRKCREITLRLCCAQYFLWGGGNNVKKQKQQLITQILRWSEIRQNKGIFFVGGFAAGANWWVIHYYLECCYLCRIVCLRSISLIQNCWFQEKIKINETGHFHFLAFNNAKSCLDVFVCKILD